jgi:hypothetical protein
VHSEVGRGRVLLIVERDAGSREDGPNGGVDKPLVLDLGIERAADIEEDRADRRWWRHHASVTADSVRLDA